MIYEVRLGTVSLFDSPYGEDLARWLPNVVHMILYLEIGTSRGNKNYFIRGMMGALFLRSSFIMNYKVKGKYATIIISFKE